MESEKYEVENATKIATAKRLLKMGKLSVEEIAEGSGLMVEKLKGCQIFSWCKKFGRIILQEAGNPNR